MRLLIATIALFVAIAAAAVAQQPVQFIGVQANANVDLKLRTYFIAKGINLQTRTMSYDGAVRLLANWKGSERYLAHMTPYACVAAEMLGAEFDILGTYQSAATDAKTYHSIFVVNQADMDQALKKHVGDPDLSDLAKYLTKRKLARFLYHDKFSTSSYFLPSLYFSDEHVFSISESTSGSIKPILVQKAPPGEGSMYLVEQVAKGNAEMAAVWDATEANAAPSLRSKVYFIPLPSEIPNDLLVLSRPRKDQILEKDTEKEKILSAIRSSGSAGGGWQQIDDFKNWVDIKEAPEALDALGELRRRAARSPHYVTVSVQWKEGSTPQNDILRAVENAVRLSGTEFVLYDKDFHKNVDVHWTVESIHDRAIRLTSQIGDVGLVDPQQLPVSFLNTSDLTTRVAALVQTRMHRVRYLWTYLDAYPAVIRDLDFKPENTVTVQRIVWADPERNDYEDGVPFTAELSKEEDFYKLQLTNGAFPRGEDGNLQFEPMSNVAYRVILKRPSTEMPRLQALTGVLLGCLVLAAGSVAWDLRRKRPSPTGLAATYRRLLDDYHRPWRSRSIKDPDVLWCDLDLEKVIQQFRGQTPIEKEVQSLKVPWLQISVSTMQWALRRIFAEPLKLAPELLSVSEVGETVALDRLIKFLVRGRRVSPFIGRPLEWDALEDIVQRNFQQLGIGKVAGETSLDRESALAGVVSRHFQEVLEPLNKASLFRARWEVTEADSVCRLSHTEDLGGDLRLVLKGGLIVSRKLLVECQIPASDGFLDALSTGGNEAWLLGVISSPAQGGHNGTGHVHVQLKPIAVLKLDPDQKMMAQAGTA